MTKHEADIIGGLNMTDQISNEAYKQIMIAAQDENEVGDVLDKIRERISLEKLGYPPSAGYYKAIVKVLQIIDKYRKGVGE